MASQKKNSTQDLLSEAAEASRRLSEIFVSLGTQAVQDMVGSAAQQAVSTSEETAVAAHQLIETTTKNLGRGVDPMARNPLVDYVAKIPGLSWLLNAVGKVDVSKLQAEVDQLKQQHPDETPEQITHRIIASASVIAAGTGLATNFVPPLAVALFAVDLAAISKIQADMLYRIAAAYGFDLNDSARRGEALAVFAVSLGSSGLFKAGLSFLEVIPGLGALLGASSNAAIVYMLGLVARQFYETKYQRTTGIPANQSAVLQTLL